MIEQLLPILGTYEGLEYTVREVATRRAENYSIKRETEMNRLAEVRHIYLTLYKVFEVNGKKYRGSCATELHPTASEAEIRETIEQGLFAAGFVENEYYPLPEPEREVPAEAMQESPALDEAMEALHKALYEKDSFENGHLCYGEIFVSQNKTRIVNSNGVDVCYTDYAVYAETAVHWRGESETEISEAFRFSSIDPTYLTEQVAQMFTVAEAKSKAKPTPAVGDINILLSGECLREFFRYYYAQSDAQYAYRQLSTLETGQDAQGEAMGDRITLVLNPELPGSTYSRPYDNDGARLKPHTIMKDGKLVKRWGSTRFAHYLHIEPTGQIDNFTVTGGTADDDALRAEPYIELVSFSDFQTNPITGDFGSEIRLGFYFDGKTTVPVTGGSVSGNIKKVQANLRMSRKEKQFNCFRGPATVLIKGASIAGVE